MTYRVIVQNIRHDCDIPRSDDKDWAKGSVVACNECKQWWRHTGLCWRMMSERARHKLIKKKGRP